MTQFIIENGAEYTYDNFYKISKCRDKYLTKRTQRCI